MNREFVQQSYFEKIQLIQTFSTEIFEQITLKLSSVRQAFTNLKYIPPIIINPYKSFRKHVHRNSYDEKRCEFLGALTWLRVNIQNLELYHIYIYTKEIPGYYLYFMPRIKSCQWKSEKPFWKLNSISIFKHLVYRKSCK